MPSGNFLCLITKSSPNNALIYLLAPSNMLHAFFMNFLVFWLVIFLLLMAVAYNSLVKYFFFADPYRFTSSYQEVLFGNCVNGISVYFCFNSFGYNTSIFNFRSILENTAVESFVTCGSIEYTLKHNKTFLSSAEK